MLNKSENHRNWPLCFNHCSTCTSAVQVSFIYFFFSHLYCPSYMLINTMWYYKRCTFPKQISDIIPSNTSHFSSNFSYCVSLLRLDIYVCISYIHLYYKYLVFQPAVPLLNTVYFLLFTAFIKSFWQLRRISCHHQNFGIILSIFQGH